MAMSSRCAIAVHALTFLARWDGERLQTSAMLADSLETNPVAVRRVLGRLRDAGLVASVEGAEGGFRLARPASAITVGDAYRAVEGGPVLSRHPHPPSRSCVVGRHIQELLEREFTAAERALERRLDETTVAALYAEVLRCERVAQD